jgi:hypothetical protein
MAKYGVLADGEPKYYWDYNHSRQKTTLKNHHRKSLLYKTNTTSHYNYRPTGNLTTRVYKIDINI